MNSVQIQNTSIIYYLNSTKRINVFVDEGKIRTIMISQNPFEKETDCDILFPFNINHLLEKVSLNQIFEILAKNFRLITYKGTFLLLPILKGGGGCVSNPKNKKKTIYNDNQNIITPLSNTNIEEKLADIKNYYFFEEDQYSNSETEIKLGSYYEKLIEMTFQELNQTNKDKFNLSIKNFRKFFKVELEKQEKKLLESKLKDSMTGNFEKHLFSLIKILKEELYIYNQPKTTKNEEFLAKHERIILERLIDNSILNHFQCSKSDEISPIYQPLMNQLIKLSKHLIKKSIKHGSESPIRKRDVKSNIFMKPQESIQKSTLPTLKKKKTKKMQKNKNPFTTFQLYVEFTYKTWLELSIEDAFNDIQLNILRKTPWNEYSTLLIIKYYNLSQKSENEVDINNRKLIEKLSFKILDLYQEREDTLSAADMMELVTLAGIKHHPIDSNDKSINQRLLSLFCNDINNDVIFDSFKVQCLAAVIFQNTPADSKASGKLDDDLKQCLDVIHKQVEHRLFTSENQNMQDAMDSLNIVLQIMAARSVKGLRSSKDKTSLQDTFKDQMPNISKQMFQKVTGSASDPSLKMKARFALEAIKRIGDEDSALSDAESAILTLAPAVYSIAKGIFTLDTDSIEEGLTTIGSTALEIYVNMERDWYDEINKVMFLGNMDFEKFKTRYFSVSESEGIKSVEVSFFIARQLYIIARSYDRNYKDRRKSIEMMGDVYEGKNVAGQKLKHFFFILSHEKKEIKVYLHKCLSDLSKMPKEDKDGFEIMLSDVAVRVLNRLNLTAMDLGNKFEYVSGKTKLGNNLFLQTLKNKLLFEYNLGILQKNCDEFYQKEIKEIDYIEIEGIQYLDKVKTNKRLPLWSKSSSNAFDEFLNYDGYSLMLIQGDAGTGKSIFLKMIEYQQWKQYKLGLNKYIPIYIRLAEINNVSKCITESLQETHSPSEFVEMLKEEKKERKYLFIFDGYDELKAPKNLFECNKLNEYGPSVKVIISSREEYLKAYGEYSKYFKANNQCLLEYRITPLNPNQRKKYIEKRVERDRRRFAELHLKKNLKKLYNEWNLEKYLQTIKGINGLEELLKTSYMLKIIIDILPSLGSDYKSKISKSNIYKVFTMKHFETEMNRLLQHAQDQIPKGFDLERSFYEYSKDIAVNMFLLDKTSVATEGFSYSLKKNELKDLFSKSTEKKEIQDSKEIDPFARFFFNDPITKLARSGVQLVIFGGQARFTHKSIMEYFTARFFYDEFKFCKTEQIPNGPLSLKLLYGGGQLNQESDVINFLKQMIDDNNEKQNLLKGGEIFIINEIKKWNSLGEGQPTEIREIAVNIEKQEEIEEDAHVLKKMRELMEKKNFYQYSQLFYKNLLILCWFCVPSQVRIVSKISINEIRNLERDKDFPKSMRAEIAKRLAQISKGKFMVDFSKRYCELYLGGIYNGELKNFNGVFLPEGTGTIHYENGNIYQGAWKALKQNGFGTLTFDKNSIYSKYVGNFRGSYFDGYGTLDFANNSQYKGEFCLGDPHGFGKKSFTRVSLKNKNKVEIYEIYEGNWRDGMKHGEGVLNWEFCATSRYKKYYGIWYKNILKSGVMEFRDGKKIEGIYLEDIKKFFPDSSLKIYRYAGVNTSSLHEKLYRLEIVSMADIKIPSIDELLKMDSCGNSVLLLLLQKSNLAFFNNLMYILDEILNKKEVFPNNTGNNFIHMLLSNKSLDNETKKKVLSDISKKFEMVYFKAISSFNTMQILPLMVALEMFSKDKKSEITSKIDLMLILTPRFALNYNRLNKDSMKTKPGMAPSYRGINYSNKNYFISSDEKMIFDENNSIEECYLEELKNLNDLWNEHAFKFMFLIKDDAMLSQFAFNEYFDLSYKACHFKELFIYFLQQNNLKDFNQIPELMKSKDENMIKKDVLIQYYKGFFEKKKLELFDNEKDNQDFFISLIFYYIEEVCIKQSENPILSEILKKLERFDVAKILEKFSENNEFFIKILKWLEMTYVTKINKPLLKILNLAILHIKFQMNFNSKTNTNYIEFFSLIFQTNYKIFFDIDNWINLYKKYFNVVDKIKTQENWFSFMKFIEFSLKLAVEIYGSLEFVLKLEEMIDCLIDNNNFHVLNSLVLEKFISLLILSKNEELTLHFLRKYEKKLVRIQNWRVMFFKNYNFFKSPKHANETVKDHKIGVKNYYKIEENNYELMSRLDLPNYFGKKNLSYKFHEGVKYFRTNGEKSQQFGFFFKLKKENPPKKKKKPEEKNINLLSKVNDRKMAIIEGDSQQRILKILFSNKMTEVFKFIINNDIFVKDLKLKIFTLSDSIILEMFLENKNLLIEKEEMIKNYGGQGRYMTFPNYFKIFNAYIYQQIYKAFSQNNNLASAIKEPKIQIILREIFVPCLKFKGFLILFMNFILNEFFTISEKKLGSKILYFLLDFPKLIRNLIPNNDYPDFICDFYNIMEKKFNKSSFSISYDVTNISEYEKEKEKRIKLHDELRTVINEFETIKNDYFEQAIKIEKKRVGLKLIYDEIALEKAQERFMQNRINLLQKISLRAKGIENNDYFYAKIIELSNENENPSEIIRSDLIENWDPNNENVLSEILILSFTLLFQKDHIINVILKDDIFTFFISDSFPSDFIYNEDVVVSQCQAEIYNFTDFSDKINNFQIDQSDEITLFKIDEDYQNISRKLLEKKNKLKKYPFFQGLWNLISDIRQVYLCYQALKEKYEQPSKDFAKLEESIIVLREKFNIEAKKLQNELYHINFFRVTNEVDYFDKITKALYSTRVTKLNTIEITKKEAKQCFAILLDFFFTSIWSQLILINKKKAEEYFFEFFDRWLSDYFYQADASQILGESLIKYPIKFGDISPFGVTVYQRLLYNCIKYDFSDLALRILKNFGHEIDSIKQWSICLEHEEELIAENEKSEERDLCLIEKNSKKIFIKNAKILKNLIDLKIDFVNHKEFTLKNWCMFKSIYEINDLFPLNIDEISKKYTYCNIKNYIWLVQKKYGSEQKIQNYFFEKDEGKNLLILLFQRMAQSEKKIFEFMKFLIPIGKEQNSIIVIQNIINSVLGDEFEKLEYIKTKILIYCFQNYQKNAVLWQKLTNIFTDNILKNKKFKINALEWLIFLLKNPEIIPYFDEVFIKLGFIFVEQRDKSELESQNQNENISSYFWTIIQQFILSFVKGILTEKQIKIYLKNLFEKTEYKIYMEIPNIDFLEEMIYNLTKSSLNCMSITDQSNINTEFCNGKSFFEIITSLMGYEIKIDNEGFFRLKKNTKIQIIKPSQLIFIKKEIMNFKQISTITFPKALQYKKQINFLEKSGIKLLETMDIFALFVFFIDLVIIILMIEEMENSYFDHLFEFQSAFKFELGFQELKIMQKLGDKKCYLIQFKWEPLLKIPNFLLFMPNTNNFNTLRNLFQKEAELYKIDYSVISKDFLELWYFDDDIEETRLKDLMKKDTPISKYFAESKDSLLVESLIYNYLINHLICFHKEINNKLRYETAERFLKKFNGDCPFLFDLVLETYGYSRELNLAKISLIKTENYFNSLDYLDNFMTILDHFQQKLCIYKRRRKDNGKKSKDYHMLRNFLKLPENISQFNLCFCSLNLAKQLIALYQKIFKLFEKYKINEKILVRFELGEKESNLLNISFSNLNGIKEFIILYRFTQHPKKYNLEFGKLDWSELSQNIKISFDQKEVKE